MIEVKAISFFKTRFNSNKFLPAIILISLLPVISFAQEQDLEDASKTDEETFIDSFYENTITPTSENNVVVDDFNDMDLVQFCKNDNGIQDKFII